MQILKKGDLIRLKKLMDDNPASKLFIYPPDGEGDEPIDYTKIKKPNNVIVEILTVEEPFQRYIYGKIIQSDYRS